MSNFKFLIFSLFTIHYSLFTASSAAALNVQEVAKELACPCECPLVLEDCNMSCGLDWKDQIGEMIKQGKTKEEIIKYFVDKYGDDAKITPMQRLRGKFYQYTRGFDTLEWTIFWGVIAVWLLAMFFAIYLLTKRFLKNKGARLR
ncbi:MAG: cytochrome c-type biogenesis protein CcmH [Deltaproteobacteria bacterium]|nr:cytochrome c-type biogenesis protein CcmH [Deltaproteobacteria bacterium]